MKRIQYTKKPDLGLLPQHAKLEIAVLIEKSKEKHNSEHSNYHNISVREYLNKIERHITRLRMYLDGVGERLDEDGNCHATAIGANGMILCEKVLYERYIEQRDGRTDNPGIPTGRDETEGGG